MNQAVLNRNFISLVPLHASHFEKLIALLNDERVWEFTFRAAPSKENIMMLLEQALVEKEQGQSMPYTIFYNDSIVGTSRIGNIDLFNESCEIGWTWLSPTVWRSGVNTECKFLLLQYAFEQLNLHRVQISASGKNERSQRAIERIGAVKEGVLRESRKKVGQDDFHDNVYYSVLKSEWPIVKENLFRLLTKYD